MVVPHGLWLAGEVILAVLAGQVAHGIVFRILGRSGRAESVLRREILRTSSRPARAVALVVSVLTVMPAVRLPAGAASVSREILSLAVIATVAWVMIALVRMMEEVAETRYDTSVKDNLAARKLRTRVQVLTRVLTVLILVVTASAMLTTFPQVRTLGASLLASAGLVGLIVGLAAQPLLTNLIAGLQIALTQPIRIDDVVIVNGEWGWIEEIDVTYVVVRVWDLRRLIVPLSYFLQQPFENWTYKSADLLGYVHIYADFRVGVQAVREKLEEILRSTPLWDQKTWNLQVTGMDAHAVEMRALFSAADSNRRWDLMVHVREELIAFLQARDPDELPRSRVELAPDPGEASRRV